MRYGEHGNASFSVFLESIMRRDIFVQWIREKACTFFVLSLLLLLPPAESFGNEIYLSISASMTDALKEIIKNFKVVHPEAELRPNFASSGSLAKQIDQGAPAHIYISANPKWMDYLVGKDVIETGTDQILAFNTLVFIGDKRKEKSSLENLWKLNRIALGSPQSVPAGQYAKQAMERAGVFSTLQQKKKLVMAKDVRQAMLYAERGEVDGAFVYKTDAVLAAQTKIYFTVQDHLYERVTYPIGLTVSGAKSEQARALYTYLNGPQAKRVLSKYGFETT